MTRERVQAWLDAYVEAWHSYDLDAIGALFSESAEYRYHPYDEPLRGRQAIVDDWLSDRDEPGSWEAAYAPLLVEGDTAVATGETRYAEGRRFSNLFVLAFDGDGRCREFTEWYMEHPPGRTSAG
jgi:ketosteroid isomerase-like protein